MKVVKVLEAIDLVSRATGKPQQRRVAILQRDDGHFSFAEEYSYTTEWEGEIIAQGWARLPLTWSSYGRSDWVLAELASVRPAAALRTDGKVNPSSKSRW
jgi:hypothetical protein